MVDDIRFVALAAALFVMSFGSVAWVMAGAPKPALSFNFSGPETRVPAIPISAPSPTTQKPLQFAQPVKSVPESGLVRGDGDPERDRLRLAALQASNAYALTPCDQAAKANMIEAVSSYAKAWHEMMGCGPNGCDYRKLNATAAAFSTPLDWQVRDAIGVAFDKRGISVEDFPSSLRINVAMLVRGRGAPATACPEARAQAMR
jgi:hypothetical protein